jgi:hypothetical protein
MPIIATAGGDGANYSPAPEGVHQAVCVDVIDKGLIKSTFVDDKTGQPKLQHKIAVVWQVNELRDDGKRFQLYKRYTLSLNEKATLRKDLESWRGRAFTREEEMGFDVETIIGANCLVNVQHRMVADKTYANVISVMPLMKGIPKIAPLDYQRPPDKPVTSGSNGNRASVAPAPASPMAETDPDVAQEYDDLDNELPADSETLEDAPF